MGIFGKLFKKKEMDEPFGDDDIFNEPSTPVPSPTTERTGMDKAFDTGVPESSSMPDPTVSFGKSPESGAEPEIRPRLQQTTLESTPGAGREMELVISKLDAIKANIESINMRLENIERASKEKKPW